MKIFKKVLEYLVLFTIGGFTYVCIEILYDGSSAFSMFVCGGLSLILIGLINEILSWNMNFFLQCLIGCLLITTMELITGILVNADYHIWDYRQIPLNFKGQICLRFSLIWYALSSVAIVLDDYIRYWLFNEDKPHYKFI